LIKTIWVIMLAVWTPEEGTQLFPITSDNNGRQFSNYTECVTEGLKLATEVVQQYGVDPNNVAGNCFLVEVDDAGEIKGLYPAELPDEEGA